VRAGRDAAGPVAEAVTERSRGSWHLHADETTWRVFAPRDGSGPAKKALATLDREWDGLAAHRDYPMIGLDNNAAERMIRGPVVTRKNAGGSRNGDTARNAAVIWTVTATAQMAGLNLLTWLTAYLDECGRNGGKPLAGPDLDRFLPWNASPSDLRTWAQPPPSPG
jgi:transposase